MNKDEALRLAQKALEIVVVDVKTTPTAYEAQRQAITAIKQALEQPEPEPVAWRFKWGNAHNWSNWRTDKADHDIFKKCAYQIEYAYTSPPKRERVLFPTMLRKMWSGGEVQAWLDENVNKENT